MAEEERAPLLVNVSEDAIDLPTPRQKIKTLYASDKVFGRHSPFTGDENEAINISQSNSFQNLSEADHIVSIFVVAFDTKAGSIYTIFTYFYTFLRHKHYLFRVCDVPGR